MLSVGLYYIHIFFQYASDALLNYFQEIQENRPELDLALETIASIMERHRKVDRVSIAAMAAVDLILTSGYLEMIVGELMVPDGLHRILAATNQVRNKSLYFSLEKFDSLIIL